MDPAHASEHEHEHEHEYNDRIAQAGRDFVAAGEAGERSGIYAATLALGWLIEGERHDWDLARMPPGYARDDPHRPPAG